MDFISAFRSLKTNNKYARKSPHKAILLLTVIDMFENKLLSVNEIKYDECLLKTYQKVWNKVLPNETTFFTNVYFPFWYMQSDGFWLNIPVRGKEDVFRELWESRAKPTENRIKELIQYAVLDDDLYFLMTMPSGRASLKRALLEEYADLTEEEIDKMCVVNELDVEDNATKAMNEYESILNSTTIQKHKVDVIANNEAVQCFNGLSENLQIALYYEYYAFLKSHKTERDYFREVFPSVEELVYRIQCAPYKQGDLNYSFATMYENFLGDLRVALISEDESMSLVENIGSALSLLQGSIIQNQTTVPLSVPVEVATKTEPHPPVEESPHDRFTELYLLFASESNRKGKSWSKEEEEFISQCYEKGWTCARIGEIVGRSSYAIYMRLTNNLGFVIENPPELETKEMSLNKSIRSSSDFHIENKNDRCYIYNANDECVFSTSGSLKVLRGNVYRFNYKPGFFTVKAIIRHGGRWYKGKKLLVAGGSSDLYQFMKNNDCSLTDIEDFVELPNMHQNQIKFNGIWYDFDGNRV